MRIYGMVRNLIRSPSSKVSLFHFTPQRLYSYVSIANNRISHLASYSLIRIIRSGVFSVHPVVHSWARERLKQSEKFQAIKEALTVLGKAVRKEILQRQSSKWDAGEERRLTAHAGHLSRYLKPKFSEFLLHEERGSK